MFFVVSKHGESRRGRSLMELMVASAILMLLLASCALALRSAMQYHRRISEQTEMENGLMLAIGALARDGAETAPAAIAWEDALPEGPALTFPIPRGEDGSLLIDPTAGNKLLYGSIVSYRVMGPNKEFRRYVDILDPPESSPVHPLNALSPPRNAAYFQAPSRSHKTLAKGMVSFTCVAKALDPDNGAEQDVATLAEGRIFRLRLKVEREFQRRYAVSMGLDLVPRN